MDTPPTSLLLHQAFPPDEVLTQVRYDVLGDSGAHVLMFLYLGCCFSPSYSDRDMKPA